MKLLLITVLSACLLMLSGCGDPTPIDKETAIAIDKCLEKNWIPRYYSSGSKIIFTCIQCENCE